MRPFESIIRLPIVTLALLTLPAPVAAQQRVRWPLWHGLEDGSYAVGFRSHWERDRSRSWRSAFTATGDPVAGDVSRPVRISVWYPSAIRSSGTMRLGDYLGDAKTPGFETEEKYVRDADFGDSASGRGVRGLVRSGPAFARLLGTPTAAHRDAPVATGRFPVIVYGLGQGDHTLENTVLCEYLASHGFIVVSVPQLGTEPRRPLFIHDRLSFEDQVRDLGFALGAIVRSMPAADPARVAAVGMSMGGVYGLLLAMANPQVRTVVGLDPSYIGVRASYEYQYWTAPEFDRARFRGRLLTLARVTDGARATVVDSLRYADRTIILIPHATHADFNSYPLYTSDVAVAEADSGELAVRSQRDAVEIFLGVARYVRCYLTSTVARGKAEEPRCTMPPGASRERLAPESGATEEDLYDVLREHGEQIAMTAARATVTSQRPSPLRRETMYRIANELGYAGRPREAAQYSELAATIFPGASSFERVGDAWMDAADPGAATRAYEQASALDPSNEALRAKLERARKPRPGAP